MSLDLRSGDRQHHVDVRRTPDGWTVAVDGAAPDLEILEVTGDRVVLRRDGRRLTARVARRGAERLVWLDGRAHVLHLAGDEADAADVIAAGGPRHAAEMPGKVVRVLAAEGDRVAAGAPLLILEAMKMETELAANVAGRVARVTVAAGDTVAVGDLLVEIEPEDADA